MLLGLAHDGPQTRPVATILRNAKLADSAEELDATTSEKTTWRCSAGAIEPPLADQYLKSSNTKDAEEELVGPELQAPGTVSDDILESFANAGQCTPSDKYHFFRAVAFVEGDEVGFLDEFARRFRLVIIFTLYFRGRYDLGLPGLPVSDDVHRLC
jgi:hypothetical protein